MSDIALAASTEDFITMEKNRLAKPSSTPVAVATETISRHLIIALILVTGVSHETKRFFSSNSLNHGSEGSSCNFLTPLLLSCFFKKIS